LDNCRSRAETSLLTTRPATWSASVSGVTVVPTGIARPITSAISAS
jgi:hypothetical protein